MISSVKPQIPFASSPEKTTLQNCPETPRCPLFGRCGGCQYQDISYSDELKRKEAYLAELLSGALGTEVVRNISAIVPSPQQYHYRCVLDLKFLRIRSGEVFLGFSPPGENRLLPADSCPIAMEAISGFLPELKSQARLKLTPRYRNANLVVKTGDDGRVLWGGIGRRSLVVPEQDYLWTQVNGKRIFYSLATFFQANLSILPELMKQIRQLDILDRETVFYDLYGGVGLFGVALSDLVSRVVLIEENIYAITVAQHNRQFNGLENFEIIPGRVEDRFSGFGDGQKAVALIDPPRAGLSRSVIERLCAHPRPRALCYLSCNPGTLARDLAELTQTAWQVEKIIPFDFFPRTKHLETLALLFPRESP